MKTQVAREAERGEAADQRVEGNGRRTALGDRSEHDFAIDEHNQSVAEMSCCPQDPFEVVDQRPRLLEIDVTWFHNSYGEDGSEVF